MTSLLTTMVNDDRSPGLGGEPVLSVQQQELRHQLGWSIEVGDGDGAQTLTLREAMSQGYSLLIDGPRMTIQVSFNATGVTRYTVGVNLLIPSLGHSLIF